jgi:hypothetical protein
MEVVQDGIAVAGCRFGEAPHDGSSGLHIFAAFSISANFTHPNQKASRIPVDSPLKIRVALLQPIIIS